MSMKITAILINASDSSIAAIFVVALASRALKKERGKASKVHCGLTVAENGECSK